MSEAQILNADKILALHGESLHSTKRLFERAAELFSDQLGLDSEQIYRALLAREKLGSTAVGEGVAIPHSRIDGCIEPAGCLITLPTGIDFSAPDNQPVDLVFVLLVPKEATQQHLDLLAMLARALSDMQVRNHIRGAESAANSRSRLIEGLAL